MGAKADLLDERLSLSGALFRVEKTNARVNNPTSETVALNKVPTFWRFDAVAIYAWRNTELQLNLNNLTNALYYSEYYGGQAVPADGRSAMLSGGVRFQSRTASASPCPTKALVQT